MPPKIQNRLKSGLWILLPLILLSFLSNSIADSPLPVEEGMYTISANGTTRGEMSGIVSFRESELVSQNGHLLNVVRINFGDSASDQEINMEFLISQRSDADPIDEGKYYVNRYISGFVSEFNGVFGYANFVSRGEDPYFSKTGHLRITNKSENLLEGTMDVTLIDATGEKLQMEGFFKALRQ
ncbi:hypothetical protein [Lentiprolixibacter aurantiacus]|uniref:Uncharacterized protein n=1 Tax=Lentiprolixibacter aurantiacus TaxID=2993939 RepID=A0AAE3SNP9_9FLAO|nr:hypothetical protein [Lentiprolixibacter aurantiacus]MCX2718697.1 hypothetical protein [Lentiprolixibacter aurantiacus]